MLWAKHRAKMSRVSPKRRNSAVTAFILLIAAIYVLLPLNIRSADAQIESNLSLSSETTLPQVRQEDSNAFSLRSNDEEISAPPDDSTFEIHFIDVGQADAALVLCDGETMLIDGGNVADSSLIYSYLKSRGIEHLDYIICTHAHEDHVGGLAGALNYASVGAAYCPVTNYDSKAFSNFIKYLDKQDVLITVPDVGETFSVGSVGVTVMGPVQRNGDPNNTSIVLRIVYAETSFLFMGDAEREEEQDILNAGYTLESTVLKVGHHGGANSTTYLFLREVMPQYAVISVGANNPYGHPAEDTLSRLRDADVTVYRTDMQGNIVCTSDGKAVSFSVQRNPDADTIGLKPNSTGSGGNGGRMQSEIVDAVPAGTDYVLNINTHKFHYPSCYSVGKMSKKNKRYYTGAWEDVIAMGYSPCGSCHP